MQAGAASALMLLSLPAASQEAAPEEVSPAQPTEADAATEAPSPESAPEAPPAKPSAPPEAAATEESEAKVKREREREQPEAANRAVVNPAPTSASGPAPGAIDEFADAGGMVFGVDRFLGMHWISSDVGGSQATELALHLGTVDLTGSTDAAPRAFFDYFILAGLSVGSGLGYQRENIDIDASSTSSKRSSFVVHPRVGYASRITRALAFWARAGAAYERGSRVDEAPGQTVETTTRVWAATLEAFLVWSPVDHFALVGGPYGDILLAGRSGSDEVNSGSSIGLTGGIAGWL